ncbi:preprotein translocase subunit SecD [Friedmanniella luteola]|uniref:Protein translocase subunit SecD n=1 Tax=Friedmanniella luteola TaxID=546871 RepID=A0A1H1UG12_9ACTN|nr:protein translocase subunit SecD [Friedmanniella luteola]SDS71320.1 preprotein translocase subunit SecD [Friedmanniella luteola]
MAAQSGRPGRTLIVLLALVVALVGLMGLSKTWTPKLGLDLQGGTTITLTAQNTSGTGAVDKTSLEEARTIIQNRVDSLGVGESEVTTAGDKQIIVSVPNVQEDRLVEQVGQTAVLRFRAVYSAEQVAPPVTPGEQPSAAPSGEPSDGASAGAPSTAPSATPQAGATPTGNNRPLPGLPTAPPAPSTPRPTAEGQGTPPDEAINYQPSDADTADFAAFTCDQAGDQVDVSDQPLFSCNREGTEKYLLGPTLIQGDTLTGATAGIPQNGIQWVVNLTFNSEGGTAFENITGQLAQRTDPQNRFAIVLDGETISAPSVSSAIPGGQAEISGSFTQASATDLANVLKYGALPLAFEVSEVSNVSATLGGEQLHAGLIAGLVGLVLVVGFCFLYYRGLGIVVIASLVVAAIITYACMVLLGSSVGFALNLPGIAGAIVAIGVTADSFVIYFERIRDEVRDGRSLRTAVETGWRRARQTVLIADAVSMLSAIILFILAIGSVKGFAFTLGLTTLIDVLVVFLFTKPLMTLLARTKFFGGGHRLSGLDPSHLGVKALPGVRTRRAGSAASAARSAGTHAVGTTASPAATPGEKS